MEERDRVKEFFIYYDSQLVPLFEEWVMAQNINSDSASDIFEKICEVMYGVESARDQGD